MTFNYSKIMFWPLCVEEENRKLQKNGKEEKKYLVVYILVIKILILVWISSS